jgi:peptidoglycan/xylan/chitin deacetylase (PgdA/CDA1 family)
MASNLWASNSPQRFWLCQPELSAEVWHEAFRRAVCMIGLSSEIKDISDVLKYTLGEAQFGGDHYKIGSAARLYYWAKPLIPRWLAYKFRQIYNRTKKVPFPLGWPVESRFVKFQWEVLRQAMLITNQNTIAFKYFWPNEKKFAFVLTHDVETAEGQRLVPVMAEMEEKLGFRSMFNFVPELYPLDAGLMQDLRKRGFEIGVHGLQHDHKLFDTYRQFTQRADRINYYLHDFQTGGFRSPLTLRNPEWMQKLEMEYDLSFFDTDPYEPMPGGVMSLWPFNIGHFIELPYTLPQDSTLFNILGETSPRIWLEKLEFIKRYHGMALVIVHPDYSAQGKNSLIYKDFLLEMKNCTEYWHALPHEVAAWWRQRMDGNLNGKSGTRIAQAKLVDDTMDIVC